jgi:catechol 2,3-dioxygenase-like lactoylglutathione lyase family enzyme
VAALAAASPGPDGELPPPQVGAIALAVADRDRAQRFYEELGFATVTHRGEGVVVYPGNGLGLALLEQTEVLACHGAPVGPGSGGFALVHPVADRMLLDDLVARAARAGATVVRPPETAGTTVRAGFTDPDGHRWTVTAPS